MDLPGRVRGEDELTGLCWGRRWRRRSLLLGEGVDGERDEVVGGAPRAERHLQIGLLLPALGDERLQHPKLFAVRVEGAPCCGLS